jgi:hypothetical protein
MSKGRITIALFGLCVLAAYAAPAQAQIPKAAWKITSTSLPTNFAPGSTGQIFLVADNLGAKASEGTITISDVVPEGLEIVKTKNEKEELVPNISANRNDLGAAPLKCEETNPNEAACTETGPIRPGYQIEMSIKVKVLPGAESATNEARIEGGAAEDATTASPVVISPDVASFDFLPGTVGLDGPFTDSDGAVTAQAGSHPYQLTLDVGFPTKLGDGGLVGAGHLHDAAVDLPRGVIINPAATPKLCTEAELVGANCPPASQVGIVSTLTEPAGSPLAGASALYNMVPPPGEAAVLAADALGVGIFVHLRGEVRSDGDYGLSGYATEIPALPSHPAFGTRADLWGIPTSAIHDGARGSCAPPSQSVPTQEVLESCELKDDERTDTALLTLPGQCPPDPLHFGARAHSWEALDAPAVTASYEGADLSGAPSHIQGCGQLEFEPALKLRPTTNLADSPTGLEAEVSQTTDFSSVGDSPSPLRDALVTLPPGLVANASQADGLAVCSSAQIGLLSGVGQSPVRISKQPESCPDAAKIGTVEVESPLLAQIDEEDNIVLDAEGNPVPRPLRGGIFLAKPFDNPFNSLIAIYIVVEDSRSGTVAKLAGKVVPDPLSGQITTRFTENPQLPLSDVRLHVFAGSRAPLQTPPVCGSYATTSALTPWAAPDLPGANPTDSFEVSATPSGADCPASEAQAPNAPSFSAGTLSPQAGAFGAMVLKLSREDGSQRIAKLEATLPAGLLARLAGVAECSEAQIAAAKARSNPEEGKLEQASPSCPAASEIGTVDVGAGAGPSPLHIGGHAYLAGSYKGAPLSVVVITPAVAGPFDLGAVVVRSALYIDPTTAQGRVVSDPLPTILQGIPADVRSVTVRVDRPSFTLNPTSCAPKSFLALSTSTLGQAAALSSPFQVGGCETLGFAPKLALRLSGGTHRGAHPAFRAVLTARPGDANIARTSLALPHSEFIDQAHFRTICTRVQFAAAQCPAGAVYGHATATSPLLDYAVNGPVYLRSSSHQLPDVVAALKGPPGQPVEIDLVGRVDSINGGIRFTFETVPDAPVTKAIFTAQGGKKGLFQNSTDICRGAHRATVKMDAQNGKFHDTRPLLRVRCGKKGGKGKGEGGGSRR